MSGARFASFVSAAAALLSTTCWIGPSAGELVIDLATPNGDTRAVEFVVTAAKSKMVEAVSPACAECEVFAVRVNDGDLRGVVMGPIVPGPLLYVLVSDVDAVDAYAAEVVEVANGALILLEVSTYALSLRKP